MANRSRLTTLVGKFGLNLRDLAEHFEMLRVPQTLHRRVCKLFISQEPRGLLPIVQLYNDVVRENPGSELGDYLHDAIQLLGLLATQTGPDRKRFPPIDYEDVAEQLRGLADYFEAVIRPDPT